MVGRDIHDLKAIIEMSDEFKEGKNSVFGEEIAKFIRKERDAIKIDQAQTDFDLIRIKGRFEGLKSVLDFIDWKIQAGEIARREMEEING